jgi:outer membrane receptor protein involved in Fe transport
MVFHTEPRLTSFTAGVTNGLSTLVSNEFRLNYSSSSLEGSSKVTPFEGAEVADFAALHGVSQDFYDISVIMGFSDFSHNTGLEHYRSRALQEQWNVIDTLSVATGHHQLKFGGDYRKLLLAQRFSNPLAFYEYDSQDSLLANSADLGFAQSTSALHPRFSNFSAFVQDEWHLTPRFNLSLGVRWDVNPAPSVLLTRYGQERDQKRYFEGAQVCSLILASSRARSDTTETVLQEARSTVLPALRRQPFRL